MFEATYGRWYSAAAALMLGSLLTSLPASAQMPPAAPDSSDRWDITLGVGVGYGPVFLGSEEYEIFPVPAIDITYDDRFFLGQNGIGVYALNDDQLTLGLSIVPGPGRDDEDDERLLLGLPDLEGTGGLRLFGSYRFEAIELSADLQGFTGDVEGIEGGISVGTSLPVAERVQVSVSANARFADAEYLDSFYGITPAQAARRRELRTRLPSLRPLRAFETDGGFYAVGADLSLSYALSDHWIATVGGGYQRAVGDAADSPLSPQDDAGSVIALLLYRF